ncbi:MAG TPA: L,D-transpeptidase family protein [Allosphingosinicella sp.]|jgi:murein L,D-transpeptidase YcbB/YkuD
MTLRLLLVPIVLALFGCGGSETPAPPPVAASASTPVVVPPEIAAFYRSRANRPLWMGRQGAKPEAKALAAAIEGAAAHGLDPQRYGASELKAALAAAESGEASQRARAELLLTRAFVPFARDLHTPRASEAITYIDEGLKTVPPTAEASLDQAAKAPDLAAHVRSVTTLNPLYASMSRGHARWLAANPRPDPAREALIRANLEKARAIPAHAGRYVIVDTASARLWMIDGRKVEGPMRVIVGKPNMRTPAMAALIRYVVLNPYWNVPPDLARERARRVLKQGPGLLKGEGMELLSDWGDRPRVISASQVNWAAVASGRTTLRMRQRPGGNNVMGAMKFMFPNALGIYLHDFPEKSLFAREDRRLSSGCVRVEDAQRLARFLFRGSAPKPSGSAPEQLVDLPEPVPVYITHLTVLPDPKAGLSFRADPYARKGA